MKILITGICGFVGSQIAYQLLRHKENLELYGLDNLIRPGSEKNRSPLIKAGIHLFHADLRHASDLEPLPEVDWVIDAAANPSIMAGVDGQTSSRQIVEHNLYGTIQLLEYCKRSRAGLILLSTSRTYSISPLASIKVEVVNHAYQPTPSQKFPKGLSHLGVHETFTTNSPISLYGATKLASETLALEYGSTFDLPVRINRCGVMAGAGQFGRPDQGIFAYWIHSWKQHAPLKYIGFDGQGHQVRDCLHPEDLTSLIVQQIAAGSDPKKPRLSNVSGGIDSATSLKQLSNWCTEYFGAQKVSSQKESRQFDLPWMVLDSSQAKKHWNWGPQRTTESILKEIAKHAQTHPNWLQECSVGKLA